MRRVDKLGNVAVAVAQRASLALCLLLSLPSLFAEQVEFDRESLAYILSRNFSEITWDGAGVFSFHSQSNIGANCAWDSPTGDHRRYARGSVIQLQSGDSKRFGTFGSGPSMFHVMITNGCAVIGRTDIPNRFKLARTLVWFCSEVAIGNEDGGIPSITKRNFCVDAEHNDGYDIERKKDFPFRFPFKALWNGYTDLLRKTRDPESVRKVIIGDYMRLFDRAAASQNLRVAGDDLQDGEEAIVCFEDESKPLEGTNCWRGDSVFGTRDGDVSARDAFIAEVVAATKPIENAWRDGTFRRECASCEPTTEQVAVYRKVQERLKTELEDVKRQESQWKAERLSKGLPEFTRDEIQRMWKDRRFQKRVKEMTAMRLKVDGGESTDDLDSRLDIERAKVLEMYSNVRDYESNVRHAVGGAAFPTNLHQLVGFKTFTGTLLLEDDGELYDGWGHEYGYRIERRVLPDGSGREYPVVISAGEDGVLGTKDDINSLELLRLRNKFKGAAVSGCQ